MTAFPQFSDQDIDNILAYIKVGPSEVIEAVSEVSSVENSKSDSDSLYYIIFCILRSIDRRRIFLPFVFAM